MYVNLIFLAPSIFLLTCGVNGCDFCARLLVITTMAPMSQNLFHVFGEFFPKF